MKILIVPIIIIVCLAGSVTAQVVVKEGDWYLHENSKVYIQGDVVNHGNVINQGILSVTGNWQNLSSYASSIGTIALKGSVPQYFYHNGQAIGVLHIENPSTVHLETDVTVKNKLILKEGEVIPEGGSKLVMAEVAAIEGGAPHAYIHGKMYHTGQGRKFYPIGKNGQYAPVTLSQISGENPVVGIAFYDRTVQSLEGNQMLLQQFYWNISSLSGKFEGSPVILDVLPEDPAWEEDQFVIAGSEHLGEQFNVLSEANVQIQDSRFIFSSNRSIRSQFITLGSPESLKEMFYLPNALSPSAPHPDDQTIKIYSNTIKPDGFQWTIWDNWGHVVFTTNSYEQASAIGWQGTHTGKGEAQPGNYKYLLQGTLNNGQTFSQKGSILLYK